MIGWFARETLEGLEEGETTGLPETDGFADELVDGLGEGETVAAVEAVCFTR